MGHVMRQLAEECLREIKVPPSVATEYSADGPAGSIAGLARLNVFIGPNNCGKSRLLRALFLDPLEFSTAVQNEGPWRERWMALFKRLATLVAPDAASLADELAQLKKVYEPKWRSESGGKYPKNPIEIVADGQLARRFVAGHGPPGWIQSAIPEPDCSLFWRDISSLLNDSHGHQAQKFEPQILHRVYIPAFRSLHHLEETEMVQPTTPALRRMVFRAYFSGGTSRVKEQISAEKLDETKTSVLTGGEMYEIVRKRLLGGYEERQRIRDFEDFLSTWFFNGKRVTLIPRVDSNVLYVKIGDDEERGIQWLGDGIQQIIIMTLPLFLFKGQHLMLFIEEPELYLHPGFQRVFIEMCLHPKDDRHQVFVATHSHQFVDITIDRNLCSVYRVTKPVPDSASADPKPFRIEASSTHDFELLRLLGVRNSSVLLSNCTIWVEGITDRLYVRRYLQVFQEQVIEKTKGGPSPLPRFLEDLHFSFVEYGGNNVVHWSFLDPENGIDAQRVCGTLLLIADRDDPKRKAKRHSKLAKSLGDKFYLLKCREVENLLTPDVLVSVVNSYEGNDVAIVPKGNSTYVNRQMGKFVETKMLGGSCHRKGGYAADSGTLKDKVDFCERACERIRAPEHLSGEAWEISEKLYRFIAHQNHVTLPANLPSRSD
jgi:hypothetical protein